ncbi:MAG TPA: hypothetical protein VK762_15245 [Polyangiaceae bacterium]|jgi:hypothetical protein|nr:hypothetical protein [Polyangiaceae bacterium]
MQTRHAILMLVLLCVLGASVFAFLGSRGTLPEPLGDAYGTVVALASSASDVFSAPRTAAESPDAGDGGSLAARRTTQAAPLSSAQLGAPLVHGKFVTECGAPDDMKVVVKVTVKGGRAIAVDVTTDPPSAAVASCVEKATRSKEWDVSPKTQHATVTY